jgi:hypothetical protein
MQYRVNTYPREIILHYTGFEINFDPSKSKKSNIDIRPSLWNWRDAFYSKKRTPFRQSQTENDIKNVEDLFYLTARNS